MNISNTNPSDKSELPDVYAESGNDGYTVIVANAKARKLFKNNFSKPRPRWDTVGGGVFTSPEYRAIGLEDGPVPPALLATAHQAGLRAMFKCVSCPRLHSMTDAMAERFLQEAQFAAANVHPGVGVIQ